MGTREVSKVRLERIRSGLGAPLKGGGLSVPLLVHRPGQTFQQISVQTHGTPGRPGVRPRTPPPVPKHLRKQFKIKKRS